MAPETILPAVSAGMALLAGPRSTIPGFWRTGAKPTMVRGRAPGPVAGIGLLTPAIAYLSWSGGGLAWPDALRLASSNLSKSPRPADVGRCGDCHASMTMTILEGRDPGSDSEGWSMRLTLTTLRGGTVWPRTAPLHG